MLFQPLLESRFLVILVWSARKSGSQSSGKRSLLNTSAGISKRGFTYLFRPFQDSSTLRPGILWIPQLDPNWVSGFVDAEASLTIRIRKGASNAVGHANYPPRGFQSGPTYQRLVLITKLVNFWYVYC
jgi:hypothetical protein